MHSTTDQMPDFLKSTTAEMIVMLQEYLKNRLILDIQIKVESIPSDGYDHFDPTYTRGIMVIPRDIFDVDKTINQLVITGYHERRSRPSDQYGDENLGFPPSITTSTGDDDGSPKRFFLQSKVGMILKLDEILKARTNTVRQLDLILKMLELIEHNTRPVV